MKFYLRILAYGRGFEGQVALAILFLALFNLFSTTSLTLTIPFLEILFTGASSTAEGLTSSVPTIGGIKGQAYQALGEAVAQVGKFTALLVFCGFMLLAIALKNAFRYLSAYTIAPVELGLIRNLRNRLFDALTRLPLGYYTHTRRGQLMNTTTTDVQNVQEAVVGTLSPLISDPLTMIFFFSTMLLISWKLTLFTLILLPLTGLFITRVAQSLKRRNERSQGELDNLLSVLDEFIGGVRIVKGFAAESYVRNKYEIVNKRYTEQMVGIRRKVDLASPVTEVLSMMVALAIILAGGALILGQQSELKASEFITFLLIFSQFLAPIKTLSQAIGRISRARVSYDRIEGVINTPLPSTEREHGDTVSTIHEGIRFEHVSFGYTAERPVLRDVSFDLPHGQTLALVGASGAGKSTVADLLCRFYEPTSGRILLDSRDVRELSTQSLRSLMGIVAQEGVLFNDTVRGNIAYGVGGYSDDDIVRAAQIANAHSFISELPLGYDTMIGERGLSLSGGQRQRLAIARAVLRNPPLLIMDEATSALDSESERLVQQALDRLMENRTCLVIAHRLSTVVGAHRIAVMDQGQVVEIGTHAELLSRGGYYRKLYDLQFAQQLTTSA